MPGSKLVRRLLISAVIVFALVLGANAVITGFAERQVGKALKTAFDLSSEPKVDLHGFPILLDVARGRLSGVTIEAEDLKIQDLRIAKLTVELDGVELVGGILSGSATRVRVKEGRALARVDQKAVNQLLRARGEDAVVRLREGSVRARSTETILGARREVVATGSISMRDGALRFDPERVTIDGEVPPEPFRSEAERRARLSVELPKLPLGLVPSRVQSIPGAARLQVTLEETELSLSG